MSMILYLSVLALAIVIQLGCKDYSTICVWYIFFVWVYIDNDYYNFN